MQNIETMLELIQSCSQTNKVVERFNWISFALLNTALNFFDSNFFAENFLVCFWYFIWEQVDKFGHNRKYGPNLMIQNYFF